jgi:ankyrin repeat protein
MSLLKRGGVAADPQDEGGQTPLLLAARGGHEAVVRLLVGRKDVVTDSKDLYGQTPLSWAAVVRLLMVQDDVTAESYS